MKKGDEDMKEIQERKKRVKDEYVKDFYFQKPLWTSISVIHF
jgi:hypothetical protein